MHPLMDILPHSIHTFLTTTTTTVVGRVELLQHHPSRSAGSFLHRHHARSQRNGTHWSGEGHGHAFHHAFDGEFGGAVGGVVGSGRSAETGGHGDKCPSSSNILSCRCSCRCCRCSLNHSRYKVPYHVRNTLDVHVDRPVKLFPWHLPRRAIAECLRTYSRIGNNDIHVHPAPLQLCCPLRHGIIVRDIDHAQVRLGEFQL
mmetsp:Transcript_30262/g.49545  ORF Transcript_30262/g.49545 Transcript_30262/m.49545 type:complete len:201 (+) Transcript_30262:1796-2398(+)